MPDSTMVSIHINSPQFISSDINTMVLSGTVYIAFLKVLLLNYIFFSFLTKAELS